MDTKTGSCRLILALLLFYSLGSTLQCYGDLVIEETTETIGPAVETSSRTVTKIKGRKKRVEHQLLDGPLYIRIEDNASGDQITLHPETKTYQFADGATIKQGLEMAKGLMATGNIKADNMPEPLDKTENRATGNHMTIGGLDTQEYLWEKNGTKIRTWMAKDFPNGWRIRSEMDNARDKSVEFILKGNGPDVSVLPGIEMRRQVEQPNGTRSVTTVISIKEQALADSEFTFPKDYVKRQ